MATEPRVSTGTIATTSNPTTPVIQSFQSFADAKKVAPSVDTGTNPPTVTLAQSQLAAPQSFDATFKKANPGQISPNSDLKPYTPLADRNGQNEFIAKNTPAPKAPTTPVVAKAPPADTGPTVQPAQQQSQPGRNKFFTNDYYLDDVELTSIFPSGTGGPQNFNKLEFKITEPNGITLLFNLNNAIRDLYNQPTAAIGAAFMVMVIRFYGWDEKGNLVTKITPVAGTPGTVPNSSNAVVTKYFPFQLSNLTFKNAGKAIEYHATGVGLAYKFAQTTALGTVPDNYQLVGETVEQVLNGTSTATTPKDDSTRDKPAPSQPTAPINKSTVDAQAIVAAVGTDINAVNPEGMAFGPGALTG